MSGNREYFYTLNMDNANLIANRICQGQPVMIEGGRASGKTTLTLTTLCELYDRIVELNSKIKKPHAFVIHPETFEKFEPQLKEIKYPMDLPLSERFSGIPLHTSPKVEKGIIRIAWTLKEFLQIVNREDNEVDKKDCFAKNHNSSKKCSQCIYYIEEYKDDYTLRFFGYGKVKIRPACGYSNTYDFISHNPARTCQYYERKV